VCILENLGVTDRAGECLFYAVILYTTKSGWFGYQEEDISCQLMYAIFNERVMHKCKDVLVRLW